MGQKKTIKLVSKLLKNDKKKDLYSPEELLYMQKQIDLMKENRRKLKEQRKRDKGFGNEWSEVDSNHHRCWWTWG